MLLVLLAPACVQLIDFRTPSCVEAVLDGSGGVLVTEGAELVVPSGALYTETPVALCKVRDPPAGALSPVWEVRPVGGVLQVPATLRLDHTGDDGSAALVVPGAGGVPIRSFGAASVAGRIDGPVGDLGRAWVIEDGRREVPYGVVATSDLLLVIDGSCSMAPELEAFSTEMVAFRPALDQSGFDYHLGVVGATAEGPGAGRLETVRGQRWFDRDSPIQLLPDLLEVADLVVEQGLGATWLALGAEAEAYNAGFLRAEGQLDVVVLSDEADQTDPSMIGGAAFVDWFLDLRPERARFHAIVDPASGDRYLEVAEATGGRFAALDDPAAWSDLLSGLVDDLGVAGMTLAPPAIPGTIEIWRVVEGQADERIDGGQFTYDAATAVLLVHEAGPGTLWVLYEPEPQLPTEPDR